MIDKILCSQLHGAGPKTIKRLVNLGIISIQDLLFHLPIHYQDRTHITPINKLLIGDTSVIEGNIISTEVYRGYRSQLICQIADHTGNLVLRFLHFTPAQYYSISQTDKMVRCYGVVRQGKFGLEMVHPEYQFVKETPLEQKLTPVYPTTEGLSQGVLRKLIKQALVLLNKHPLTEYIPNNILQNFNFPELNTALYYIHAPEAKADIELLEQYQHPTQQRLIWEELLAHFISILKIRFNAQKHQASPLPSHTLLFNKLLANLPFTLTKAQEKVIHEISQDLIKSIPMLRLLQGDVGSGKTIVAVASALQAVENNKQVAIMAPTEILAEQHYRNFCHWLQNFPIKIAWLTGKTTGKKRTNVLQNIENGQANIIIGTHALIQENVKFADLALVIIDEQHRFGVHQRLALREKGINKNIPHQLIMTATPIPRTLAMLAYADLDCSIIDELPPGRKPITTKVITNSRRDEVLAKVEESCQQGRQVYWVCPLIEESPVLQCEAAETTAVKLTEALPNLTIGLIHGRLKGNDKQQVMENFKNGKIQLLVATTVIEVGIDVKNASLMVIENAERLGLAQLHQLRGRVGRGSDKSFCLLMYQPPLSKIAKERLLIFREQNDGFILAQKDLELRGPGELLGTQQKGLQKMRVADIVRDRQLLTKAQSAAVTLLQDYFSLTDPLLARWIGIKEKYGNV